MRIRTRTLPQLLHDLSVDQIIPQAPRWAGTHVVPISSAAAGAEVLAPRLGVARAQPSHRQSSRKTTLGRRGAEETGECRGRWTSYDPGLFSGRSDILDVVVGGGIRVGRVMVGGGVHGLLKHADNGRGRAQTTVVQPRTEQSSRGPTGA